MIGHVAVSAFHKGTLFTQTGSVYALLNGQTLSRTAYPDLSTYWPIGAYGSTSNTMVLPDLGNGYYLRGHGYNNGYDPGISSRTTPSGILPVAPSGIGTFQTGTVRSHIHAAGTQASNTTYGQGGGDGNPSYPQVSTGTSATASNASGATVGAADANVTDLSHMKFYPYIRIA